MTKIVILNEELGSQMQIYLALCDKYEVEIAESVKSAMYLLRKVRPEILLVDYNLDQFRSNGDSGLKFLRKVKKKYNAMKVVTILEDKDKNMESKIHENGGDSVIYKPIRNRSLISHVKKLSETNTN